MGPFPVDGHILYNHKILLPEKDPLNDVNQHCEMYRSEFKSTDFTGANNASNLH